MEEDSDDVDKGTTTKNSYGEMITTVHKRNRIKGRSCAEEGREQRDDRVGFTTGLSRARKHRSITPVFLGEPRQVEE